MITAADRTNFVSVERSRGIRTSLIETMTWVWMMETH